MFPGGNQARPRYMRKADVPLTIKSFAAEKQELTKDIPLAVTYSLILFIPVFAFCAFRGNHHFLILLSFYSTSRADIFLVQNQKIPSLSIHLDTAASAELALLPWIAIPGSTVALGHALAISFSLRPIPLPSWVQKGTIIFLERS